MLYYTMFASKSLTLSAICRWSGCVQWNIRAFPLETRRIRAVSVGPKIPNQSMRWKMLKKKEGNETCETIICGFITVSEPSHIPSQAKRGSASPGCRIPEEVEEHKGCNTVTGNLVISDCCLHPRACAQSYPENCRHMLLVDLIPVAHLQNAHKAAIANGNSHQANN